jgi:hypothetical protein
MDAQQPNNDANTTMLDQATARRLACLRTMPVDTRDFEKRLTALIPSPARSRSLRITALRPLRTLAASLLIVGVIAALLISTSGGPALASVAQMAQVHEDLVSGKTPAVQVDSIEAANRELNKQSPDSPAVPNVPQDHVMACCMKSVKNKRIACVLLKTQGVPVTMTVANASDMKLPTCPMVTRDGITYHVQSTGKLNMITTQRNGRWVCLIGQITTEQLMEMAAKLQF